MSDSRRILAAACGLLLAVAASASTLAAATLEGRVTLLDERGKRQRGEMAGAVVYFTPRRAPAVTPAAAPVEVETVRKAFSPRVAAVPVGSTVAFPNRDPILHNVFSVSGANRFDLGFVRRGESGEATFDEPGVVRVFCNVHHGMVAYVLVLDTPFHTVPAGDGGFRLDGLPDGEGTLTVWHERAEPRRETVRLPHREALALEVTLTKPRVPPHNDKNGRPYSRRGRRYR